MALFGQFDFINTVLTTQPETGPYEPSMTYSTPAPYESQDFDTLNDAFMCLPWDVPSSAEPPVVPAETQNLAAPNDWDYEALDLSELKECLNAIVLSVSDQTMETPINVSFHRSIDTFASSDICLLRRAPHLRAPYIPWIKTPQTFSKSCNILFNPLIFQLPRISSHPIPSLVTNHVIDNVPPSVEIQ